MALVLAMAVLPLTMPERWERRPFQAAVVLGCAVPIALLLLQRGLGGELWHGVASYGTFIATLFAMYVVAGGVFADGDLRATPAINVTFLLVGAVLANLIGTTGASMLLIRPLLRTNVERKHTGHLVPFFIMIVANAGGLLTPLGDPPLLVGFVEGVPFFWTLRLLPIWLVYNLSLALVFYLVDRRAYARETREDLARDLIEQVPLTLEGTRNLVLLGAIVPVVFVPSPFRELALLGIALGSYFTTPRELHRRNEFSFGPINEVALLFAGLFVCLVPIERMLGGLGPRLPLQQAYQLFWASGALSAVLDNAPTYAAFAALGRGMSHGQAHLVAGIAELKLVAISAGCVVMGATTYIGNGPNLMVKAIAERAGLKLPSFFRYAALALLAMLPAHLLTTLGLLWLER